MLLSSATHTEVVFSNTNVHGEAEDDVYSAGCTVVSNCEAHQWTAMGMFACLHEFTSAHPNCMPAGYQMQLCTHNAIAHRWEARADSEEALHGGVIVVVRAVQLPVEYAKTAEAIIAWASGAS